MSKNQAWFDSKDMQTANMLKKEKQEATIRCLVEGASVRSTEAYSGSSSGHHIEADVSRRGRMREADGLRDADLVGGFNWTKYEADNFRTRIPSHKQWIPAVRLGATYVHPMVVPQAAMGDTIERQLIQICLPPLKTQLRRTSLSPPHF